MANSEYKLLEKKKPGCESVKFKTGEKKTNYMKHIQTDDILDHVHNSLNTITMIIFSGYCEMCE